MENGHNTLNTQTIMIEVSVIIPTCNRPGDLARCLRALTPQLGGHSSEVIVADDSRDEDTQAMLKADFPTVKITTGPRRGPGANRNAGARQASGEWLVFMDDDVIPAPGFLQAYFTAFADVTSPNVLHGLTRATPEKSSLLWEAPEVLGPLPIFPSCNFAIRRTLYEKSGGFDERFSPSFEDMEFASRLQGIGELCGFMANAIVEHPLRPLPNAKKLALRWEPRVISALDLGARPEVLPLLLTKHVMLVIVSRFRGARLCLDNLKAGMVFTGEFLWFLLLLPRWLRKHAKAQRSQFWDLQRIQGKTPLRFGL
jgi:GT2 family glycosyltransferase